MEKISKETLKRIRLLMRDKAARDKKGVFIAEGEKIIQDLIRKGHILDEVLVSRNMLETDKYKILLSNVEKKFPVFMVDTNVFERISNLQNSQGILGIVRKPNFPAIEEILDRNMFLVLCDGIQDPGNLGTIIRTSVAFGVDAILLTGEAVDVYNPKVVRASSGTLIDIPIYNCGLQNIKQLKKKGYYFMVSGIKKREQKDIANIEKLPKKVIVAFGSEGSGVSREVMALGDEFFCIPIKGVESLNVSIASAIALYVFQHIRHKP